MPQTAKPPARKPAAAPRLAAAQLEEICSRLAEGQSLRAICRALGVKESSARYFLSRDAAAFEQAARARELGCDAIADECIEIADDGSLEAAERRIRIDTRMRLIGKRSSRYAERVEHSGPGGAPIQVALASKIDMSGLNDDQLRALASIRVRSSRESV